MSSSHPYDHVFYQSIIWDLYGGTKIVDDEQLII